MSAVGKCFTPSSVILLLARPNLFSTDLGCVSALVKCSTPLSVICRLLSRPKLYSWQLVFMSAVVKCFKPSSVILLLARPNLFSLQSLVSCVSASVKCLTPLSVIRLLSRPKLFSLQLVFVSALVKCFTPLSVISSHSRPKLRRLQQGFLSAVVKCSTASSVKSLPARFKLLSLQLVFMSASVKSFTPLSVIPLLSRPKLFSLQFFFMSAVVKYVRPSSVMPLPPRFKLLRLQKPSWLRSMPPNHLEISLQPREAIWLDSNLKCSIFSPLDWSACTNVTQSKGDKLQKLKSSALQSILASLLWTSKLGGSFSIRAGLLWTSKLGGSFSIWAGLLWTSKLGGFFSYMQLNKVTTSSLSSSAGQQVTVSVRSLSCSLTISKLISLVTGDKGRRLLKISVDCSSCCTSPATNCITPFHDPSLMWSETNVFSSPWLMVSTKYFAAKNSCTVRWRKQYWAFPSS